MSMPHNFAVELLAASPELPSCVLHQVLRDHEGFRWGLRLTQLGGMSTRVVTIWRTDEVPNSCPPSGAAQEMWAKALRDIGRPA